MKIDVVSRHHRSLQIWVTPMCMSLAESLIGQEKWLRGIKIWINDVDLESESGFMPLSFLLLACYYSQITKDTECGDL